MILLQLLQVAVEATLEHPFYVIGQGWSSASPERTLIKFQLPCNRLKTGDVCISLSQCSQPQQPRLEASEKMMRPPPPPQIERRRSNSASPSDKLLLKRAFAASTLASTSPLASKRFPPSASPTKQVAFEEPLAKRPKSDQKWEKWYIQYIKEIQSKLYFLWIANSYLNPE